MDEVVELSAPPDPPRGRRYSTWRIAGHTWLAVIDQQTRRALAGNRRRFVLRLHNIDFITFSCVAGLAALIDRVATQPGTLGFEIDMLPKPPARMPTRQQFFAWRANIKAEREPVTEEFKEISRMFDLVGFLESLHFHSVINAGADPHRVTYLWLLDPPEKFRGFITDTEGKPTVVNPLDRIDSPEQCRRYLDSTQLQNWRRAMAERFRDSPLFEFEELWRVFCFELTSNIVQHAKKPGYVSARVIAPHELLSAWRLDSFNPEFTQRLNAYTEGCVELCVSDFGRGILETLGDAYFRQEKPPSAPSPPKPSDILAFAFDELGTSKSDDRSWVTERHALGRILSVVAKYGGILSLSSNGARIVYWPTSDGLIRRSHHLGYEPQHLEEHGALDGTHLQVILPLSPRFEQGEYDPRWNLLTSALPLSFTTDKKQPQGHLVPLRESLDLPSACITDAEYLLFRFRCTELAAKLSTSRSPDEPLVLDFRDVVWPVSQIQTFLHLLQNVLIHRPVLLIELPTTLLGEVVTTEKVPPTPEYQETYEQIHATVLALDINGIPRILGLRDRWCEKLLLRLLDRPATIDELTRSLTEEQARTIRAVLNRINPLFRFDARGVWSTVWSRAAISIEARRVMSTHFDDVAERCAAWRGRPPADPAATADEYPARDTEPMVFNLPWQDEWVEEFFQSSRILSRQRYADEAAQRLIYRLRKGLELTGQSINNVKVLACVTSPAIMLAAALHRWWPTKELPAVADLGPYLLLDPEAKLPAIVVQGGIVIVQDVRDRGRISHRLFLRLQEQGRKVFCILSLARLAEGVKETSVTQIDDGWLNPETSEDNPTGLPDHYLVRLPKPPLCPPCDNDDPRAHWVEPRTLRPFSYRMLRRQPGRPKEGKADQGPPRERARPFFQADEPDFICAGHYVYGERHYTVALDIKRALEGRIGDDLTEWLVDICHDRTPRSALPGLYPDPEVDGEVSGILMPLHSQIHYLWPKLETALAKRGRRVPMWMLDATLFLGHGPSYRLPLQCEQLIHARAAKQAAEGLENAPGLNLLILDDAMVSGRTAETILSELNRAVSKAVERVLAGQPPRDKIHPVRSIRYFAVFNQLDDARNRHWHYLRSIDPGALINFRFQSYCSITGLPVFDGRNCPTCADEARLHRLAAATRRSRAGAGEQWALARADAIRRIATDSPEFHQHAVEHLPRAIDLRGRDNAPVDVYFARTADEAILRFHELMYLSYPPADVLAALKRPNAWPPEDTEERFVLQYQRFRQCILEWCVHNWARLIADCALGRFFDYVWAELEADSPLTCNLFEMLSLHRNDELLGQFIRRALDELLRLDLLAADAKPLEPADTRRLLLLEKSLSLFLHNFTQEELQHLDLKKSKHGPKAPFPSYMEEATRQIPQGRLSFTKPLWQRLSRSQRQADPHWALEVIAENLFRGRDPHQQGLGFHLLLPRLLHDQLRTPSTASQRLLECNLSVFLAALEDIEPFAVEEALPLDEIRDGCGQLLRWFRDVEKDPALKLPWIEIHCLLQQLDTKSRFCEEFSQHFHFAPNDLWAALDQRREQIIEGTPGTKLEFKMVVDPEVAEWRLLISFARLFSFIHNWTIDPARKAGNYASLVHFKALGNGERTRLLCELYTRFGGAERAKRVTHQGPNYGIETSNLTLYGAELLSDWTHPPDEELAKTFQAYYSFTIPVGITTYRSNEESLP